MVLLLSINIPTGREKGVPIQVYLFAILYQNSTIFTRVSIQTFSIIKCVKWNPFVSISTNPTARSPGKDYQPSLTPRPSGQRSRSGCFPHSRYRGRVSRPQHFRLRLRRNAFLPFAAVPPGRGTRPQPFYFNLFSSVALFRAVSRTLEKPYSEVSTKDFGRSSQGTTSPSASARCRNSRVRLDVDVLSRSKIPIMLRSRTAISLPIERYIRPIPCRGGVLPAHHLT